MEESDFNTRDNSAINLVDHIILPVMLSQFSQIIKINMNLMYNLKLRIV